MFLVWVQCKLQPVFLFSKCFIVMRIVAVIAEYFHPWCEELSFAIIGLLCLGLCRAKTCNCCLPARPRGWGLTKHQPRPSCRPARAHLLNIICTWTKYLHLMLHLKAEGKLRSCSVAICVALERERKGARGMSCVWSMRPGKSGVMHWYYLESAFNLDCAMINLCKSTEFHLTTSSIKIYFSRITVFYWMQLGSKFWVILSLILNNLNLNNKFSKLTECWKGRSLVTYSCLNRPLRIWYRFSQDSAWWWTCIL